MRVHFTTECTVCSSELRAYKTKRRNVRSADMGGFVAVEHMRQCENGHPRIVFRSEKLKNIVNGHCTCSDSAGLARMVARHMPEELPDTAESSGRERLTSAEP